MNIIKNVTYIIDAIKHIQYLLTILHKSKKTDAHNKEYKMKAKQKISKFQKVEK